MKNFLSFIIFLFLVFAMQAQNVTKTEAPPQQQHIPQAKVKVYPNPATSVVNVLGLKNTPKADISILDIYGNIVLAHEWEIRRNAINIPIAALESGAYIIAIRSKEQQVRTKFLKK